MLESQIYNEVLQRGREIARVEVTKKNLLLLIHARFQGQLTKECVHLIETQQSYDTLAAWFEAAVTSATAEDFLAVMNR